MTKEILIQYTDMQEEIKELQESKERTERNFKKFLDGNLTVSDMVKGGSGGIQHFKIEGFPIVEYEKVHASLKRKIQRLENKYTELLELTNQVEEYIDSIEDGRMRRIITLRFIDKLTWNQIADRIGGGNTEGSVRMAFNRFIEGK